MKDLKTQETTIEQAYWSWDVSDDTLSLSNTFSSFFGCTPDDLPDQFNEAESFFSSSDLKKLKATLEEHLSSHQKKPFHVKTTHNDIHDNEAFTLEWRGEVIDWDNDKPLVVAGVAEKIVNPDHKYISFREKAILFEKLMHNLPDSIYFKDLESRFTVINESCAEKFGLDSPEDVVGKTDFDFFEERHAQAAYDDEQRIIETEEPIIHKVEKESVSETGEGETWASTTKMPLYNDEGEVVGTFGITRDVTSQQKAEEELRRNEAMISRLSDQVPGFFYLYHQTTEDKAYFPYASAGIRDIYELNPEDVKETITPIANRIHEEDLTRVAESIEQSFQTLEKWDIDYRVVLPEKGLRWVRGKARPEKQPDGSVIGYGYITDITEEKEAFESIARLRKQLQQVIDFAPNLIFIKNIDGEYLMANESAATFFGETTTSIVGKTDVEIGVSEERARHYLDADRLVIQSKEVHHLPEEETTLQDGSEVWHQTIKVPFFNTDSGKPAVLSVVTDITQLKKKEIELNSSLDIIGEQNKHLMNFAHIVSHNLRNHAGNISMLLSLYDMEESDTEKEELLEHLGVASKRLNESISDLNEIIDQQYSSKGEMKTLNLKETVNKIEEILTTERLANNVNIQKDIPANLSLKYNPAYLESIVLNLLSNAIKYRHPDRKPEVAVKAEEREGSVHLEVSDNGLGIDLEKHGEKLFGMYNTFHQNKNSKGIGLFITKNQIESMGGSIDVQSKPNEGTTFKIKLS